MFATQPMTALRRLAPLLLVLAALAGPGCEKKPGAGAGGGAGGFPPSPVTAAMAVSKDVPIYLDEIGRCAAKEMVTIIPQAAGRITQLHYSDGDEIKKGQLLVEIDPLPYQAVLKQALANQNQAKANLDFARLELSRVEKFLKANAISQQDYDIKKNALDVAIAQVEEADAAINAAQVNLDYCKIYSPIDGRAGQKLVDVGNVVKANEGSLLVIQRIDPIYADFTITEGDLVTVREQMAKGMLHAQVLVPNDPQGPREGELTFLDSAVLAGSGTVKLRATLKNADHHYWPGQFVTVRLVLSIQKDAVLVPAEAVQIGQIGPFVYVVKGDSTADMRPVKPGQRQGDLIVLNEGVKAGETVVTTGQMAVAPGAKVRVADEATKPSVAAEASKS